jgi:hypothetical protein
MIGEKTSTLPYTESFPEVIRSLKCKNYKTDLMNVAALSIIG